MTAQALLVPEGNAASPRSVRANSDNFARPSAALAALAARTASSCAMAPSNPALCVEVAGSNW